MTPHEREMFTNAMVVIGCILLGTLLVICAPCSKAHASGLYDGQRNFDVVRFPYEVPEGMCMWVTNVPRAIDSMKFPKPLLMCKTNDVVGVVDYK